MYTRTKLIRKDLDVNEHELMRDYPMLHIRQKLK